MIYAINNQTIQELGKKLSSGGIAVIPTDTQYGIVGSALNDQTVEQIYKLRQRSPEKPMIILISDIADLALFGITLDKKIQKQLEKWWPNPLSVILLVDQLKLEYLHRGKKSLAFRLPKLEWLQQLLKISGPLVAPSANFEGEKPARSIQEAHGYFAESVDYLDSGTLENPPSTVISIKGETIEIVRQGAYPLEKI